ncbi:MAG: ester cyclase, partial [Bacteroidales bacterium]
LNQNDYVIISEFNFILIVRCKMNRNVNEEFKPESISVDNYSDQVNPVGNHDYNDYLKVSSKGQKMKGFDPEYKDFVDYILNITHRIWEEKGIGIIYDTYHNNVTMHAGSVNIVGIKEVISGTLQTLHAFPDRRLIGQNVIWSPYGKDGYFSSHRIISTATNLGDSQFGSATHLKVNFRTTVDCAVEANRIYEEWLVRDNLWIVMQLKLDPIKIAKEMAKNSKNKSLSSKSAMTFEENMEGQLMPSIYIPKDNSISEWVKELLSKIYAKRLFNEVKNYYSENAAVHFICDQDLIGHQAIQKMLVTIFASFPNARYKVDRITVNKKDEKDVYDIAVRWQLVGLNEGYGFFGKPTYQTAQLLGINHLIVKENKVVEEWVTFDGLDVLRQLYIKYEPEKNEGEEI